jgi:exosortase/archaeosortase family protein
MTNSRHLVGVAWIGVGLSLAAIVYYLSIAAPLVEPVSRATARGLAFLLTILGFEVSVAGAVVASGGFAVEIAPGCTPLAPLLVYLGAIGGYPSTRREKITGAILGVVVLTLVNWGRVTSLFLIGRYFPQNLDFMHVVVFQSLLILLTVGLWMAWVQRFVRPAQTSAA